MMKFRSPDYYEKFQCIADRCEDTCCAGWEIDIDDESYEYYQTIKGNFGERLRKNIKEYNYEEDEVYEKHGFILQKNRRCPFLDENNLCEIYRELGEGALCDVCTDTPRNYLEYGGAREVSLSASCAEAGRFIYGSKEPAVFVEKEVEGEFDFKESEEELFLAKKIQKARDEMIVILQNREADILLRAKSYLVCAKKIQDCLNANLPGEIDKIEWGVYTSDSTEVEKELDSGERYRLFLERMRTFSAMDSISEEWEELLQLLKERYIEAADAVSAYEEEMVQYWNWMKREERLYEYEHLLVYYSFLCLARSINDSNFLEKAKITVISFLMIRDFDCAIYTKNGVYTKEDRINVARIYAKEVEHSPENMECLEEDILFEDTYTVENLCASLTSM